MTDLAPSAHSAEPDTGANGVITPTPKPASPFIAMGLGFAIGCQRIVRRRAAWSTMLSVALVATLSAVERRVTPAGAVSRTLAGTFGLVIPLISFGVTVEATARSALRDCVWPVARYGMARRDVALGVTAAAMVASGALGAILAMLSVLFAHGVGNPPLATDALTSTWIGALTAVAYTGWFMAGATFGRRGRGRWVPLILDFMLGGTTGFVGALLPRFNAQNLLGLPSALTVPQTSSCAVLGGSAVVLGLAAGFRCRD